MLSVSEKTFFCFAFLSFFCTFVAYYDKKRRRNKK